MSLEPLFLHLKKNDSKGDIKISITQIEEIIDEKLPYAAKVDGSFWRKPKIKRLMKQHNLAFGYIDSLKGLIHFVMQ